jgi:Nucleotidyl transferase AbiEii toxin, Type IV TA system
VVALQYATPHAFRAAVRDRFGAFTDGDHGLRVEELQRQFAYDRVLARCFAGHDADRWVLKGAVALLARLGGRARHSKDVDLFYMEPSASTDQAVEDFLAASRRDLGDHFRFEITRTSPLQEHVHGRRLRIGAYLGARFATFHVDIVVGTAMSGEPDLAAPLTPLRVEGLLRPSYRVFPVADHLADKLCAITETHQRADGTLMASTRVKDLVDVALIAGSQPVRGAALRRALITGAAHRGLTLPPRFVVPDLDAWRTGYLRRAADAPTEVPSFRDAADVASRLFDPVLAGPLGGSWDPGAGRWLS